MKSLYGVTLALVATSGLAAQEGHERHGERLGRVRFPVSCNADAQQRFARAMALLHSFWWEEGERAFGAVLEADSSCAMGYWGLAVNAWGNPFAGGPGGEGLRAGAAAAVRAATRGAPTARERGFIAAAGALYRGDTTLPNAVRLRAYSDTLARVYRDHPKDVEVAIYYALSLVATASPTDTTFERQKRAAAILNPLFRKHPDHPGLAHYIIHANDSPRLAHLGLEAARRYARIAPSAPHAQHMPSHIFVRLGLWDETVASNRRSYEAGVAYLKAQGMHGVAPHEFHAFDYMVYGYLQRGQDAAARRVVDEAFAIRNVYPPSSLIGNYNRTAMEARIPLERGDWATAARLPVRSDKAVPVAEMLSRFARGIGAARSGDTALAQSELARLAGIEAELTGGGGYDWSRVAGIKRRAVTAWIALARGDTAGALRESKGAADLEEVTEKHPVTPGELLPARELEADMLLGLGRYDAARRAYEATLTREPGRARSIFGAARAADLAGDRAAAWKYYREFLDLMAPADGDRLEIVIARGALSRS
jgi:hypothetical protein